jgi:dissimilatory sulfite reductase related protein
VDFSFRRLNCRFGKKERKMGEFRVGDRVLEIDEDGFIQDLEQWDNEVADALAATEGVDEMGENHWKLVSYIRDYYKEFGSAPMIRKLCRETGFKLNEIYELFPSGPAKGACKVAGLPKPTGCV